MTSNTPIGRGSAQRHGFYWAKRHPDHPWEVFRLDDEGRWWLGDELWSHSVSGFASLGPRIQPPTFVEVRQHFSSRHEQQQACRTATEGTLRNRVVLVVEDEFVLANEIADSLNNSGAVVLGPAGTIDEGVTLCQDMRHLDAAILDVNLRGRLVFSLADQLSARGVPFVFATGYDAMAIPAKYAQVVRCEKPLNIRHMVETLSCMLQA